MPLQSRVITGKGKSGHATPQLAHAIEADEVVPEGCTALYADDVLIGDGVEIFVDTDAEAFFV